MGECAHILSYGAQHGLESTRLVVVFWCSALAFGLLKVESKCEGNSAEDRRIFREKRFFNFVRQLWKLRIKRWSTGRLILGSSDLGYTLN